MPYQTGTASDYQDLFSQLISFLTTNPALVSANQNWTNVRTVTSGGESDVLLRGPGLAGEDEIFVRLASVSAGANVGFSMWGFTSYNSTLDNASQPGIGPSVGIPLWTNAITYWFIANGRRFIVIAKVSTSYFCLYGGFLLPYADPDEYPYPMFIGGACASGISQAYTVTDSNVNAFWHPDNNCTFVRAPNGSWVELDNSSAGSTNYVWPNRNYYFTEHPTLGNAEWPAVVNITNEPPLGTLHGVFISQSNTIAAEDIDSVSGQSRIVIPSVFRTDTLRMAQIALE